MNQPVSAPPPRETNPLALISMIAGIIGVTLLPFLASIVAIITGHLARGEIRRNPARYSGDGMAVTGLVLGYIGVVLTVLVIVIFLMLIFGALTWSGRGF